MGFLGTLLYIATAGWMIYFGYTVNLNYGILLAAPLGFVFGHVIRKSQSSSRVFGREDSNVLVSVIKSYLTGLVLVAIFFAIGYGILFIMGYQPPPGAGAI
jgi:hypothetical protein